MPSPLFENATFCAMTGKVKHRSRGAAKRNDRRDAANLEAYKCVHCGAWHLGHKQRKPVPRSLVRKLI